MYRRRKRRSAFARQTPPQVRWLALGAGAAVLIGLFVFFIRQSDQLAPAPQHISVELPDAFKE